MNTSTLAAALESALNLYLGLDPENLRHASTLQGKVIALEISGSAMTFYFLPGAERVRVLSHYEGDIDTYLRGTPLGFARLGLARREDALFQGAVSIEGDTGIGQQFQQLLARTEWDWEEQLSRLSGDVLAHQAGHLVAQLQQLWHDSRETLADDCSEYLQEEARLLPTSVEVQYFFDDVDRLRDDSERLRARLERLLGLADPAP